MGVLAVGAGAIALIAVVGIALIALVVIVVGPSRRVRAEPPLDPAVEAALLLGEDPDEVALEATPNTCADAGTDAGTDADLDFDSEAFTYADDDAASAESRPTDGEQA
jgi:hypothetical protein